MCVNNKSKISEMLVLLLRKYVCYSIVQIWGEGKVVNIYNRRGKLDI
jgi:hypothetical protein